MTSTTVSIIIPSYNRGHCLGVALESVLSQTVSAEVALDVIVVDDGSTDNTRELVAEQYPEVRYFYKDNAGVSSARNVGLGKAKGDWIALLDSDDEWLSGKLEAQLIALNESGLKVCHTQEIWIRNGVRVNQMNKHKKHGGQIFEYCLPLCAMSPSSILLSRCVFDDVGVFDESLPACEDYDLWLRIAAKYEVVYLEQAFIKKTGGHEDQLSRQYWGMDRFRVVALDKILRLSDEQQFLTTQMYESAHTMLIKKLTILRNGAVKHSNAEQVALCDEMLTRWVRP